MFSDLKASYERASKDLGGLQIIPGGEAFQNAIDMGLNNLHRDTYHASLGLGRYILGCVWYSLLTGNNIENNTFSDLDEYVEDAVLKKAKKCAQKAIKE